MREHVRQMLGSRFVVAFWAGLLLCCACGVGQERVDLSRAISRAKSEVFPALIFVKPIVADYGSVELGVEQAGHHPENRQQTRRDDRKRQRFRQATWSCRVPVAGSMASKQMALPVRFQRGWKSQRRSPEMKRLSFMSNSASVARLPRFIS